MSTLFEARLGTDALIRQSHHGLLRRVRHGDASLVVDSDLKVGLVLNLSDAHHVKGTVDGTPADGVPRIGSVTVMPPRCVFRFAINAPCRVLALQLPWREIGRAAEGLDIDAENVELRPCVNKDDPTLARLIYASALMDEDEVHIAMERIACHLVLHHAPRAGSSSAARPRGGIATFQLRRVLERIDADLEGDLPVSTLAAEAGMSAFHFSREFARTTGLPPHGYVVRRRVERAILLLARPDLGIAEISRMSGFAHSSHLARHMQRLTGVTPEVFRGRILP